MKILVCLVFVCCVAACTARGDQFRFREKRGDETFDVSYVKVRVLKGNAQSFEGRTDKYGRIMIKLPNGSYTAEITRGGSAKSVAIAINGQDKLKTVHVQ